MVVSARPAPIQVRSIPRSSGWPLRVAFLGFPLWWALGIGAFIWPLFALPMALSLIQRRTLRAPRGFWLWILFLLWVGGSATQLTDVARAIPWTYRAGTYLAATVLFLYIYNAPPGVLSDRRILSIMAIFWGYVTVGGLLGVLAPHLEFRSLAEMLLPRRITANEFVSALVHPSTAQMSTFLGYEVPRPKAPFEYTNDWGAVFALTTPLAFAAWPLLARRSTKTLMALLLVASVLPVVLSLNRGLWLSLGLGLLYVLGRSVANLRGRPGAGMALGFLLVVILSVFTPLRTVIESRLETPHSNPRREALYQEAIRGIWTSPVLGFGAPRPSETNPNLPSVGTQGQLWLVLYSQGLPGLFFYAGWHLSSYLRTLRRRRWVPFWCNVVVLIAMIQFPFYGHLAAQLQVIMVAMALGLRPHAEAPDPSGLQEDRG